MCILFELSLQHRAAMKDDETTAYTAPDGHGHDIAIDEYICCVLASNLLGSASRVLPLPYQRSVGALSNVPISTEQQRVSPQNVHPTVAFKLAMFRLSCIVDQVAASAGD